jgi:CsoR family transcriptional regulator, copper-sensing transcriptional repressor
LSSMAGRECRRRAPMIMDTKLTNESDKRALILRLKRVEGQLRGVQQLIEKDAPCESVAQQLSAARRALDKAFHEMVGCLIESKLGEDGKASSEAAEVREILSRYG